MGCSSKGLHFFFMPKRFGHLTSLHKAWFSHRACLAEVFGWSSPVCFKAERDSSFLAQKSLSVCLVEQNRSRQSKNLQNDASTHIPQAFYAADGGRTRTLSPERDFKSLVSANFTTAARLSAAHSAADRNRYYNTGMPGFCQPVTSGRRGIRRTSSRGIRPRRGSC